MPQQPQEAIFATAAIEAYRQRGSEKIVLLCAPSLATLFTHDDRFLAVVPFEFSSVFRHWRQTSAFISQLLSDYGPFSAVVNLDASTRSVWLAARIRTGVRAGYPAVLTPPFVFKHLLRSDPALHRAEHYVAPIAALSGQKPVKIPSMKLVPGRVDAPVSGSIGLIPSGPSGSPVEWGPHRWAESALRLSTEYPLTLVSLADAEASVERMDEVLRYNGVNRFERIPSSASWLQLRAVLSSLKGVIATEGVLAQMSIALGIPTVVIFGPGNPALSGPLAGSAAALLYKKADCAPCAPGKPCPHLRRHCLEAIAPQEAIAALKGLLP